MAYTTSNLIEAIKSKALVPSNQNTFTPESMLAIADEELQNAIVPAIMAAREDFFVTYMEYDIVNGQALYDIPPRAIGMILHDVTMFDSINVASTQRTGERSIPWVSSDSNSYRTSDYATYSFQAFFIRGNKVVLTPPPNVNSGVLRLYYYQRPSRLVPIASAARIDDIDTVANTITVSNLPTTMNITTLVDFIKAQPGFDTLDTDSPIVNISGLVLTFSELPSGLSLGDYIALAGETPVMQIPIEFHSVLAQRVAVKILEAIGDVQGSNLARTKLQEIEMHVKNLIQPRVHGEFKKVVNPFSTLNTIGRSNRWNGY